MFIYVDFENEEVLTEQQIYEEVIKDEGLLSDWLFSASENDKLSATSISYLLEHPEDSFFELPEKIQLEIIDANFEDYLENYYEIYEIDSFREKIRRC